MSITRPLLTACLMIALASQAHLTGEAFAGPAAAPGSASAGAGEIDFSALRYYAALKDTRRVAAEIRLLHAEHPNWQPSADLLAELKASDIEQPLWDLYSRRDFAELRTRILKIQESKPDWRPSAVLLDKVAVGEARERVIRASDDKAWAAVAKIAAATPGLMSCEDFDTMWRIAEAEVHAGSPDRALDAYRTMLKTCTARAERLATVQKASMLLQPPAVESLLAASEASGSDEFKSVRLDMIRRKIGTAAAKASATPPSAGDLDALGREFAGSKDPGDAQLLGWFAYSRKRLPEAEAWFRRALDIKVEAKSAEGLVMVLRNEGKHEEAETLASASRDLDRLNREQMIDLVSVDLLGPRAASVPRTRVAALVKAIDTDHSANGAQAYGWYLYRRNAVPAAFSWFRKSAGWTESESAAIGQLVCANRLKRKMDFSAAAKRYRALYPAVARLEAAMRPRIVAAARQPEVRDIVVAGPGSGKLRHVASLKSRPAAAAPSGAWDQSADEIVKTYQGGNYDKAVALLDARRQQKPENQDLSVMRGWALYHRGDWAGARTVFSGLKARGVSSAANEGLRVIDESETPQARR